MDRERHRVNRAGVGGGGKPRGGVWMQVCIIPSKSDKDKYLTTLLYVGILKNGRNKLTNRVAELRLPKGGGEGEGKLGAWD